MLQSYSYKSKEFLWLVIKLSIVIGCGYFIYVKGMQNEQIRFSDFYSKLTEKHLFLLKSILFFNDF